MPQNPLLASHELPPFAAIQPDQVLPAIETLIDENRRGIAKALEQPRSWAGLVEQLELLDNRLSMAWSPVSHLHSVRDAPELREAYNACLPLLAEFGVEVGQNEALCAAYKELATQSNGLDAAQRKVLDNALRDFHLAGVDLAPEAKARFKAISQQLSSIASRFEQNILDATQAWTKAFASADALQGLPETALGLAAQAAHSRGQPGWLLTLEFPSYHGVMTYADDRALRQEVYEAYSSRASDQGPHAGQWNNGPLMEEILSLRHEAAQLLGFANYAERSLATKMASSTAAVLDFLHDLARRARFQAEAELRELADFAREAHGINELKSWDIGYYSEKLRQQRYALSQEELRPYFPAPRVVAGLFGLAERLFGLRITEVQGVETWHPDVRFFAIHDLKGELRGRFYLDLYARQHKRGGAWMDECAGRLRTQGFYQTPVAFLTCNFTPPLGEQPALLTHDEVQTLFHEFGHGLHQMLTRIDQAAISGINGVAWDAVELPSQFLENFAWERQVLDLIAGHWQNDAPLPQDLYDRMLAAKNFQSAMQTLRQIEFALFDFRIHQEYDPKAGGRIYEILQQVRDEVAVLQPPQTNRFAHGFSHIFAGGYAAGYYSYKWAEVLSSDAYARFEEEGILNPETGRDFLQQILEKGGSEDAMQLFQAFRGRAPSIEALLRHSGIAATASKDDS
jgi:oligopeptidase A